MKFKSPFAIILLSLACRIMAATFSPPSGLDKFPADGFVNPVAGLTLEKR